LISSCSFFFFPSRDENKDASYSSLHVMTFQMYICEHFFRFTRKCHH